MVGGGIVFLAIFLTIVLAYVARAIDAPRRDAESTARNNPPPARAPTVEALVLMRECWTPCSAYIDYKAKIRGEGNPLRITFPGVRSPVDYPGEGDFKAPSGAVSGEVTFSSLNDLRPNVRVQIYKRTTSIEVR
jgi:hypothetical protein